MDVSIILKHMGFSGPVLFSLLKVFGDRGEDEEMMKKIEAVLPPQVPGTATGIHCRPLGP